MTEEERERLVTAVAAAISAAMLPEADADLVRGGTAWNLALSHASHIATRTIRLVARVDYTAPVKRLPREKKRRRER